MQKFLKILSVNLIILILIMFTAELVLWYRENKNLQEAGVLTPAMKMIKFHDGIKTNRYDFNTFAIKNGWGREPEGLEYSDKKPIVVFGCSFAYGYQLDKNQTFSHKLSALAHRTVYNRAFTGWSIQHMLYQTKLPVLYKNINEPEYVIYIFIKDHIRRLFLYSFSSFNILNEEFDVQYLLKNGKLVEENNDNMLLNQFKRLYFVNILHHYYVNKYMWDKNDKTYNLAFHQLLEAKNEMQKRWKNTKFVILMYDDNNQDFIKQLRKIGYIVIYLPDLVQKNLADEKYMYNKHSKEAAWDIIVPKVIEKLGI